MAKKTVFQSHSYLNLNRKWIKTIDRYVCVINAVVAATIARCNKCNMDVEHTMNGRGFKSQGQLNDFTAQLDLENFSWFLSNRN